MKRFWLASLPYLVIIVIATLTASAMLGWDMRRHEQHCRIPFVLEGRLFYIEGRDYHSHWIVDDRLILETNLGPIELWVRDNHRTLETIRALGAQGFLQPNGP